MALVIIFDVECRTALLCENLLMPTLTLNYSSSVFSARPLFPIETVLYNMEDFSPIYGAGAGHGRYGPARMAPAMATASARAPFTAFAQRPDQAPQAYQPGFANSGTYQPTARIPVDPIVTSPWVRPSPGPQRLVQRPQGHKSDLSFILQPAEGNGMHHGSLPTLQQGSQPTQTQNAFQRPENVLSQTPTVPRQTASSVSYLYLGETPSPERQPKNRLGTVTRSSLIESVSSNRLTQWARDLGHTLAKTHWQDRHCGTNLEIFCRPNDDAIMTKAGTPDHWCSFAMSEAWVQSHLIPAWRASRYIPRPWGEQGFIHRAMWDAFTSGYWTKTTFVASRELGLEAGRVVLHLAQLFLQQLPSAFQGHVHQNTSVGRPPALVHGSTRNPTSSSLRVGCSDQERPRKRSLGEASRNNPNEQARPNKKPAVQRSDGTPGSAEAKDICNGASDSPSAPGSPGQSHDGPQKQRVDSFPQCKVGSRATIRAVGSDQIMKISDKHLLIKENRLITRVSKDIGMSIMNWLASSPGRSLKRLAWVSQPGAHQAVASTYCLTLPVIPRVTSSADHESLEWDGIDTGQAAIIMDRIPSLCPEVLNVTLDLRYNFGQQEMQHIIKSLPHYLESFLLEPCLGVRSAVRGSFTVHKLYRNFPGDLELLEHVYQRAYLHELACQMGLWLAVLHYALKLDAYRIKLLLGREYQSRRSALYCLGLGHCQSFSAWTEEAVKTQLVPAACSIRRYLPNPRSYLWPSFEETYLDNAHLIIAMMSARRDQNGRHLHALVAFEMQDVSKLPPLFISHLQEALQEPDPEQVDQCGTDAWAADGDAAHTQHNGVESNDNDDDDGESEWQENRALFWQNMDVKPGHRDQHSPKKILIGPESRRNRGVQRRASFPTNVAAQTFHIRTEYEFQPGTRAHIDGEGQASLSLTRNPPNEAVETQDARANASGQPSPSQVQTAAT